METFVGVLLRKTVAFMVFEQRLLPQQVSHFSNHVIKLLHVLMSKWSSSSLFLQLFVTYLAAMVSLFSYYSSSLTQLVLHYSTRLHLECKISMLSGFV